MGKKLKKFLKVVTAIISIGGILYIARDQIKAIIDKLKELKDQEKDENLDDWDPDAFDDDDVFPDSAEASRDYFSIHITDDEEAKEETLRKRLLPRTTFPTRIRLLTHQKKMINKRTPMLILSA